MRSKRVALTEREITELRELVSDKISEYRFSAKKDVEDTIEADNPEKGLERLRRSHRRIKVLESAIIKLDSASDK